MSLEDILENTPTGHIWKEVGIHPHHGINLPLSSLHSRTSCGIGEFYDLLPLIDWVSAVHMDVIQMLPLNDAGFDPSPYNALSSLALDPVYIKLDMLPGIDHARDLQNELKDFQQLNEIKRVKYVVVKTKKMRFLRRYFQRFYQELKNDPVYQKFLCDNPWVQEYALFLSIKNHYLQKPWRKWPEKERNIDSMTLFSLMKTYDEDVSFHTFIQFHAQAQMKIVKEYATKKGVFLKGDIPILLSPDSVDVWYDRENFEMDYSAGCPPDVFNMRGQNWGFPLINWEHEKRSNYAFWKRRLGVASRFYHLYRIDHLVGFFRIWSFEKAVRRSKGHFRSNNRYAWPFHGEERLRRLIDASPMLPMAEDLGTIPQEVPGTLKKLGITSTKVIRWTRYWEEDGSFVKPENYEPISLSILSSHDTETVGEWWENNPLEAKEFAAARGFTYKADFDLSLRMQVLEDAHNTASLFHINLLPEYLKLFPELSWDRFEEDRINISGTELATNWTFRFKTPIEEIINHKGLFSLMQSFTYKSPEKALEVQDA